MNGAMVGAYPLRVLPSKTAIVPVNNQFLPRTPEERELCGRTVYVANIDKKVDKQHVLAFFEKQCGAPSACGVRCCHLLGCLPRRRPAPLPCACMGTSTRAGDAALPGQAPCRASGSWATTTTRRASPLSSSRRPSMPRRRWTAAAHCLVRAAPAAGACIWCQAHWHTDSDQRVLAGSLPIRVSPSKAPVRDDPPPR